MPSIEDSDDGAFAVMRSPGRFQVSRRFKKTDPNEPSRRYAYEVHDTDGDVVFDSEDGWELQVRSTPSRQQLKAIFFEAGRAVPYLAFQRFTAQGKPVADRKTLILKQEEIALLRDFLAKIELVDLVERDGVCISSEAGRQLLEGRRLPADLLRDRAEEVAEFLRSDLSAPDVTALARRQEALKTFEQMLTETHCEPDWQAFLETEPWILGAAGAPQFLHRVGDKLEQVVRGWDDLGTSGKRVDSLMRTAGALSALTFVEIKRPDTSLLRSAPYRPGAWAIDHDIAGGVAQLHATVDAAQDRIGPQLRTLDADGFDSGLSIELCRPRSILVAGSLSQMLDAGGRPNHAMFRSFEAFRRSLRDPEVVTFDELHHRARAVLDLQGGAMDGAASLPS